MMDLTQILFEQRSIQRDDENEAHISDLCGCDRATWHRRNGHVPEPFTAEKLAQFAIGLGYEREVGDTLREAGLDVKTGMTVDYLGLTGHPDIVIDDKLLVETKTTDLQNPKDSVSLHYAVQAAAYALALSIEDAVVLVKHAKTHIEAQYFLKAEGYREMIEERAREIHETTGAGMPPPPAVPNPISPWGCRYCDYRMCPSNPKHAEEIRF
jgi:CRISPR/Cas system-associated exonuclease Cas4 (RecB family)